VNTDSAWTQAAIFTFKAIAMTAFFYATFGVFLLGLPKPY